MSATTHRHRHSAGTRRRHAFAAILLVFVYLAQPVLALGSARCLDHDCGTGSGGCCCSAPAVPVQALLEEGCCASDSSDSEASDSSTPECDCRTDSKPFPRPGPLLPPESSDATGSASLLKWIRAHAELFGNTTGGPAAGLMPRGAEGGAAGPAPPAGARGNSFVRQVLNVSTWALLTRGVAAFLAVLSLARI